VAAVCYVIQRQLVININIIDIEYTATSTSLSKYSASYKL
jgi:hypothetical protein